MKVKRIVIHFCRMLFGFILYWVVAMAMPVSWWIDKDSWLFWTVPVFGYYAHDCSDNWFKPIDSLSCIEVKRV